MDAGRPGVPELDRTGNIAAGLYEILRAEVVAGRFSPGQRLSEASLGRQYGVSRSPVREAVASLERDGLVVRNGMVIRVRERTEQEILDIYQLRIHMEGATAADAAQRRQPVDLRRLASALDAAEAVDGADPEAMMSANRLFHDALAAAAHNQTLSDLQERLTAQVHTLPATTLSTPGRWAEAREEHRLIMRAVEDRDSETARSVAERHLTEARDIRISLYESAGSAPATPPGRPGPGR
jgi:DNA-binding GntR family transcriptional regulator